MAAVSTPCIKLCIIDELAGLCGGCGRTLDEIASWGSLDERARQSLMGELPARLDAVRAERRAAAGRREHRGPTLTP